jgi:enoyl-[acyl-carrier protein] reductase I
MGFLQDRKILVTGLLSSRSIAYGIAAALAREGATLAFTYQAAELRERVEKLAQEFGAAMVLPCDVAYVGEIAA